MRHTVRDILNEIDRQLAAHPEQLPMITAEFESILERFPVEESDDSEDSPEFRSATGQVLADIEQELEIPVKLSELRLIADRIAEHEGVPLLKTVRNHRRGLAEWIREHWTTLQDIKGKIQREFTDKKGQEN